MAESLFYNFFPLKNEANENDAYRENSLILEYHPSVEFTIDTNTDDVEVPTNLDEVLGIVPAGIMSTFDAGDSIASLNTDGVITTGAVTVRIVTASIANGAFTTGFFLLGKRKPTAISVS